MAAPRPRELRGPRRRPVADVGWWLFDLTLVPREWLAEVTHRRTRRGRLMVAVTCWLIGVVVLTLTAFPIAASTGDNDGTTPWLLAGGFAVAYTLVLWQHRDELL